jgi:hypothetical protein
VLDMRHRDDRRPWIVFTESEKTDFIQYSHPLHIGFVFRQFNTPVEANWFASDLKNNKITSSCTIAT